MTLRLATKETKDTLDAILLHVREVRGDWPLPASLLIDAAGKLQVVYLGPVSVEQVLADSGPYGRATQPEHRRSAFGGRWYFRTPRNLPALAAELRDRGLHDESAFYTNLHKELTRRSRRRP